MPDSSPLPPIPPAPPADAPSATGPLVVALVDDGLALFEYGIVAEIFGLDRPEMGPGWYRFRTCAEQPGQSLRATGGVRLLADAGLEALAAADLVVIPGWRTDGAAPSAAVAAALLAAHGRGARIATICSGAFLPAALGLLDGRRAATHWRHAERLARLYPAVRVDADVLYVDAGDILTSAGSAAGIDLLLHVVRGDFGAAAANRVARRLVMPPHREGGQAQFIDHPVPRRPDSRLAPLLDRMRAAPAEDWSLARMASLAAMSERTFIRRFQAATGTSPGDWLLAMRMQVACDLLETQVAGLEEVAATAGFGSLATLRHHFRQRLGLPPSQYRARFARTAATAGAPLARRKPKAAEPPPGA